MDDKNNKKKIKKMLDFYHNLNISSGIMLHDIESDKNSLSSCGAAGGTFLLLC